MNSRNGSAMMIALLNIVLDIIIVIIVSYMLYKVGYYILCTGADFTGLEGLEPANILVLRLIQPRVVSIIRMRYSDSCLFLALLCPVMRFIVL